MHLSCTCTLLAALHLLCTCTLLAALQRFTGRRCTSPVRPCLVWSSLFLMVFFYCCACKGGEIYFWQQKTPCSLFNPSEYNHLKQLGSLRSFGALHPTVCDETQNLNDTDSEIFFGTKFFRDRFRDFFRYQNFPRPVPIPSKK